MIHDVTTVLRRIAEHAEATRKSAAAGFVGGITSLTRLPEDAASLRAAINDGETVIAATSPTGDDADLLVNLIDTYTTMKTAAKAGDVEAFDTAAATFHGYVADVAAVIA